MGHVMPGNLQQPCPSSEEHNFHPPRMDVQPVGAQVPCPVTQGDQVVGHKWVHNPSCVSGLSLTPLTPDVGQGGFIAEARGTSHAIDVFPNSPMCDQCFDAVLWTPIAGQ